MEQEQADTCLEANTETSTQRLQTKLLADLYGQVPNILGGSLAVYAVNFWFYFELLPVWILSLWSTIFVLATLPRLFLYRLYSRAPETFSIRTWHLIFITSSALLGANWMCLVVGCISLLSPEMSTVAIITLTGVLGSAVATNTASQKSFHAMALSSLLPVGVVLLLQSHPSYQAVGVMTITYLVVLSSASRRVHAALRQAIEYAQSNEVLAQKMEVLSSRDSLTGLSNRRALNEGFAQIWRGGARDLPVGLILCDIDYFKQYNDSCGHVEGDACLVKVATALKGVMRSGDMIARYGGEEFAALIPGCHEYDLGAIAERMRKVVGELEISHPNSSIAGHVSISVGGSLLMPREGNRMEDLVKRADEALYVAKDRGRNRVCLDPAISAALA